MVFYDPTGKTLPTGQTWVEEVKSLGDECFRLEFSWGHQHSLRVPGVCQEGNLIFQGVGPGGIELSCNTNVTLRDIRQGFPDWRGTHRAAPSSTRHTLHAINQFFFLPFGCASCYLFEGFN